MSDFTVEIVRVEFRLGYDFEYYRIKDHYLDSLLRDFSDMLTSDYTEDFNERWKYLICTLYCKGVTKIKVEINEPSKIIKRVYDIAQIYSLT